MKPMTKLSVKSVIGPLEDGQVLKRGVQDVVGVAFSGEAGIAGDELSFDGGKNWRAAALEGPPTPYGFRVFRNAWRPDAPGRYVVASRATDAVGATQPELPLWNPGGYHYDGSDRVEVEVRA
jgi:Mo-co oxidoreductase dimerisation domain